MTDHEVGVEYLKTRKSFTQVSCFQYISTRNEELTGLFIMVFSDLLETNLLEIEDDVGDIFLYAGNQTF